MADTDPTAEADVDEGLRLYSEGELDEALARWRAALERVPDHPRARDYIKYVEDNRGALEQSFKAASGEAKQGDAGPESAAPGSASGLEPGAVAEETEPSVEVLLDAEPPGAGEPHSPPVEGEGGEGFQEEDATPVVLVEEPEVGGAAAASRHDEQGGQGPGRAPSSTASGEIQGTPGARIEDEIESTTRMSLDDLKVRVEQTKARLRQASQEMQVVERRRRTRSTPPGLDGPPETAEARSRKETPLTLLPGGGQSEPSEGFDPQEKTPAGISIPRPSRVVDGQDGGFDVGEPTPVVVPQEEDILSPVADGEGGSGARAAAPHGGGEQVESMLSGAQQLHEQGTYEGSLWLCERVLSVDPENEAATSLLEANRAVLLEQFVEEIGDVSAVPVVQIPQHEIMWHKLDHRAGFLLSRIDGQLSFEDIIDVSGMPRFEATRILAQLLSLSVIGPRK